MGAPGWFGKLPMLGDFAHRRLPMPVVAACDGWLSAGMSHGRASLGPAWLDTYLHAPLWCFAWGSALVDDQAWRGVLMPSADAVGRYFPLLLMSPDTQVPRDVQARSQWHGGLVACALAALADGATLAGFEHTLAQLPAASMETTGPRMVTVCAPTRPLTSIPEPGPEPAPGSSLWWLPLSDVPDPAVSRAPTAVHVCRGLPDPATFAALLSHRLAP